MTHKPIIVVGCPRSGTTLLQVMLHAHPRIAIPPETRFLLDAYRRRREFGDLRDADSRRGLARWIVEGKGTRFGDLGLDPQQTIDEITDGPPTLGSALGIVFRAYARRFGKVRWGDKRPSYYQYVPDLLRLFPDAQFIHVVRDGRDCVGSLKQMPWYHADSYHAMATWAEAIDYGREHSRSLGPERFHEVRYERLIADPEGELTALCGFLGEEFHPAMCRPQETAGMAVPERKTWHGNTHRDVSAVSTGAWKGRLEPWEVRLSETVLKSRFQRNGYELTGTPRAEASRIVHYTKVAAQRRIIQRKRRIRDRWNRMHDPDPGLAARLDDVPEAP